MKKQHHRLKEQIFRKHISSFVLNWGVPASSLWRWHFGGKNRFFVAVSLNRKWQRKGDTKGGKWGITHKRANKSTRPDTSSSSSSWMRLTFWGDKQDDRGPDSPACSCVQDPERPPSLTPEPGVPITCVFSNVDSLKLLRWWKAASGVWKCLISGSSAVPSEERD